MSLRLYGIVTLPVSVTTPSFTLALTSSKIVNCVYRSTLAATSLKTWKSLRGSIDPANAALAVRATSAVEATILLSILHLLRISSLSGKSQRQCQRLFGGSDCNGVG